MMNDRPTSPPKLLKVVAYTDALDVGGAEISLGHLVATASKEIHITVVGVSESVIQVIAADRPNTAQIVLPRQGVHAFLAHLFTFQQLHPGIIHCNLCTPWACATALTAALLLPQIRVVRVDQLPLRTTDALTLWRTRALCLRVDAHVAVGIASAQRMEDFYALGRDSIISIPNGVPDVVTVSKPVPVQPNETMVVGSIGRLDAMKAHDVLLKAVAQVEGVRVVILGEGAERANLEKLAVELGIYDRVSLPGWVNNPRSHLQEFDVVAMPSRSEGFPLAMIEAMLAARPVIATRVGSMPEAIINGETGILIERNDVNGLAGALCCLRDDPTLRTRLGKQAREKAIAHFTVESMTAHYEHLWYTVMSHPHSPRLFVPRPKD